MGISYTREHAIDYHFHNDSDFEEDVHLRNSYYVYVNAYEVTLGYGGPEEGGWWFDVGVPLSSIRVRNTEEEVNRAYDMLEHVFKSDYEDLPDKSSTASSAADLRICIEDHFAEYEPRNNPRYE